MDKTIQEKLLDELLFSLEGSESNSLIPALRKAVRFADLINEMEYRYLFQIHIDGWQKDSPGRTSAQRWNKDVKPKWDVVGIAMEDRMGVGGMIQGLSIQEIENIISGLNKTFDDNRGEETTLTLYNDLISIHNRIAARVSNFATQMQKRLLNMNSESEKTKIAPNKGHIFIGHGRSLLWRDLKDFLHERLGLICDEFNREPTAGITTIERLEMMLLSADFAFIVMTGEDEHSDGSIHARENVIHEIGLFQGKLGFKKAIILLEEGCSEFSNIHGLTQIRFPKGDIISKSEEIRRVLEREGILNK